MTPDQVRCTSCKVALRVPETAAGKSIQCPKCGTAVTVPVAETEKEVLPPAFEVVEPDDTGEDDDRPVPLQMEKPEKTEDAAEPRAARKKRRRPAESEDAAAWRKVRLGALLLLIGMALSLVRIVVGFLLPFLFSSLDNLLFSYRAAIVMMFVQAALSLAGAILLAFTPRSHAPRMWINICIGLTIVVQLASLGTMVWAFQAFDTSVAAGEAAKEQTRKTAEERSAEATAATESLMAAAHRANRILFLLQIVGLLANIEAILFPLFLRELASSLSRHDLVLLCEQIIKLTVLGIALSWLSILFLWIGIPIGFLIGVLQFMGAIGSMVTIYRDVVFVLLYIGLREATEPLARGRRPKHRAE